MGLQKQLSSRYSVLPTSEAAVWTLWPEARQGSEEQQVAPSLTLGSTSELAQPLVEGMFCSSGINSTELRGPSPCFTWPSAPLPAGHRLRTRKMVNQGQQYSERDIEVCAEGLCSYFWMPVAYIAVIDSNLWRILLPQGNDVSVMHDSCKEVKPAWPQRWGGWDRKV